jgi:hypothetical protein
MIFLLPRSPIPTRLVNLSALGPCRNERSLYLPTCASSTGSVFFVLLVMYREYDGLSLKLSILTEVSRRMMVDICMSQTF